ncbi:MAG: hypothetical protein IT360_02995 [Gemmatimonadaceae bacterium]|nr:hypothetical protein [Gemmatimonadaceae bacterium]
MQRSDTARVADALPHAGRAWYLTLSVLAALVLLLARDARAQAWAYPSFQPPATTTREFNFGIADAGSAGTAIVFQWREGYSPRSQFSLDVGFSDPDARGADNVLFVGGQYGYQIAKASADVPLDFLLTAGAGLAFGNKTTLRVPLGVSIGHRFPLDGSLALTPYVHPRVSLDFCGGCKGDESQLGINFDVGANLELTRVLAVRGTAFFGGSDRFGNDGIGISLVWTPPGLRR